MAEYKFKEITLDGEKYVSKKDLLAAIKGMKKDSMEGTKPGYIQEKKGRRLAAFLALNHLGAELTRPEREKEDIHHEPNFQEGAGCQSRRDCYANFPRLPRFRSADHRHLLQRRYLQPVPHSG